MTMGKEHRSPQITENLLLSKAFPYIYPFMLMGVQIAMGYNIKMLFHSANDNETIHKDKFLNGT